jgi:hypothetical protein
LVFENNGSGFALKIFSLQSAVANVIKLFTSVIFHTELECMLNEA